MTMPNLGGTRATHIYTTRRDAILRARAKSRSPNVGECCLDKPAETETKFIFAGAKFKFVRTATP